MARVLLAGESWSTTSIHTKGFDSFVTTVYEEGGQPFIDALRRRGHEVVYMPSHVAASSFPNDREALSAYDVVVLSDIGANTLLLRREVFLEGQVATNRLRELADWVVDGGSLMMVGGYMSFTGIESKANYRNSPLAEVLPVDMEVGDDRQEVPEGVSPTMTAAGAEVLPELAGDWPKILGFQRLAAHPTASVLATVGDYPLIAVGAVGQGRTAAVATDMGPHWLPQAALDWPGFEALWDGLVNWLAVTVEAARAQ